MTFEILASVDFVAVLAATIVSFAIGWIYYSPAVAGKAWMKQMKINPKNAKKMKKGMGKMMVGVLISMFIIATSISVLTNLLGITTVIGGATLGLLLWAGLIATTMAMNYMHGRSAGLYEIDTVYQAISFVVMGAVIVLV